MGWLIFSSVIFGFVMKCDEFFPGGGSQDLFGHILLLRLTTLWRGLDSLVEVASV